MNKNKKILIGLLVVMAILFITSIILSLTGNFVIGGYMVIPMVILIFPTIYFQRKRKEDDEDESENK